MKRIIGKGHSQPANWNIYKHEAGTKVQQFLQICFKKITFAKYFQYIYKYKMLRIAVQSQECLFH